VSELKILVTPSTMSMMVTLVPIMQHGGLRSPSLLLAFPSLAVSVERHGRDGRITGWLAGITARCRKHRSVDMVEQCGACCTGLLRVL
jgi:hypothetical protein